MVIKSTPAISVIVPVYNAEKYIAQCIESVLSQSFQNFELLLIDDSTPDSSDKICDEYAAYDSRIRVFHKKNEGVSSARNLGLDAAQGEYVIFLDADDFFLTNDCLKQLYDTAQEHYLDIVRGDYVAVDENGIESSQRSFIEQRLSWANKTLYPDKFVPNVLRKEFFVVLMLMKRCNLTDLHFPPNQVFLEDMHFLMYLFQKQLRCQYLPLKFYAYRKVQSSVSCSCNVKNMIDSFSMCDVFAQLSENAETQEMRDYCRYNSVMMYYWTLDSVSQWYNNTQRDLIIKESNLFSLQKKTQIRKNEWKISNKALLILFVNLKFAIRILRMKAWIAHFKAIIMKNL